MRPRRGSTNIAISRARSSRCSSATRPGQIAIPADEVRFYAKQSGLSIDDLQATPRALFEPTLTLEALQPIIDVAYRYGAIKRRFRGERVTQQRHAWNATFRLEERCPSAFHQRRDREGKNSRTGDRSRRRLREHCMQ